VVAAWLLIQVTETIFPLFGFDDTPARIVVIVLVIGFIPALIFAWAFEMTPEGLKKESEVDRARSLTPHTGKKLDRMIMVVLALALGYFAFDKFVLNPQREVAQQQQQDEQLVTVAEQSRQEGRTEALVGSYGEKSIAVLPFVNMSSDVEQEYFSDGISEELLNVLVRIKDLRVPSRTSSFIFKGSDKNVSQIGSELQVDHVLEGSVRKAGNQIRVTAQLIEVSTDTHLWSDTYTRELTDIFAVQDEIAKAIVEALKLTLSVGDKQKLADHSTSNIEAYNKYLQGRYLWNKRTVQSLYAAVDVLGEAIALDPEFSRAWATLAEIYRVLPEYDFGTAGKFIPMAREAVKTALAIDPESAPTLAISGSMKAEYDFDWDGANTDLLKAIELEPGYATAHQWYADILMPQGRTTEAFEQLRLAAVFDPVSTVIRHHPGYFYLWTDRLDEAEKIYMSVFERDPYFRWTYQNLDMLYTMRGEYDKARDWATKLARMEGYDPAPDLARIDAVENPELKPQALELLAQREDIVDGVWGKAMQYALMDEFELALESLEQAFETKSPWRVQMNWVVTYEPLHDNPRYQAMLRKMNLPVSNGDITQQ
jgi:adenylate cyclase